MAGELIKQREAKAAAGGGKEKDAKGRVALGAGKTNVSGCC